MSSVVFYRKRLVPDERGLLVITDKLVSIHETPCFHFCVPEGEMRLIPILSGRGESLLSYAKRRKILKRISKSASRIAFETEEQALLHLRFLKRKQLAHIKRDEAFIEKFLAAETLESNSPLEIVPGSAVLVGEHYVFD